MQVIVLVIIVLPHIDALTRAVFAILYTASSSSELVCIKKYHVVIKLQCGGGSAGGAEIILRPVAEINCLINIDCTKVRLHSRLKEWMKTHVYHH